MNKLSYNLVGEGQKTLICLHGFLENRTMWHPFLPDIQKNHKVLLIDLPGHGESPVYKNTHSMDFMAEKVNELITDLSLDNITLVGHSMGGYVALALAEIYPHLIKGLVLLNSTPYADSEEKKQNRLKSTILVQENKNTFIKHSLPNLFQVNFIDEFPHVYQNILKTALSTPVSGIVSAQMGMAERASREVVLSNLAAKKLVIIGEKDKSIDIHTLQKGLMDMDTVSSQVLETAHMSHVEDFKNTARLINQFLKED